MKEYNLLTPSVNLKLMTDNVICQFENIWWCKSLKILPK